MSLIVLPLDHDRRGVWFETFPSAWWRRRSFWCFSQLVQCNATAVHWAPKGRSSHTLHSWTVIRRLQRRAVVEKLAGPWSDTQKLFPSGFSNSVTSVFVVFVVFVFFASLLCHQCVRCVHVLRIVTLSPVCSMCSCSPHRNSVTSVFDVFMFPAS
jgi:hypothetical protein